MTLLVGMELVMNADTNTDTNTAMRMRFQDRVTKMSLNPTALKLTAPTVKVCTKASMPAIAQDLDTTITTDSLNVSLGMMMRADLWSKPGE